MSVVLVNGDGNPAVYASQDADLLGGIGGQETGILDINDKFAATIADANTVKISSGVCITKEGRRIQIDVGDVEEVVVPTGSQGTTKYYIIGFHLYTDGSGNQLAETFIDEVASPSATITEKMFKDGETEVYVSLYRITRNGLNLEGLTLILPEIGSLAGGGIIGNTDISGIADGTLTGAVAELNTDLSVKYNSDDDWIYCKVNGVWQRLKKAYLQSELIYDDGVMYYNLAQYKSDISGAATTFGEHSISIAITTNYGSSGDYYVGAITSEQIDLTNYDRISINYSNLIQSGGRRYLLIAVVDSSNTITELASVQADSSAQSGTLTADISNTQGSYRVYVCIGRLNGASHALPMSVNITNISLLLK